MGNYVRSARAHPLSVTPLTAKVFALALKVFWLNVKRSAFGEGSDVSKKIHMCLGVLTAILPKQVTSTGCFL